eukprot:266384-Pelagomonas_calceolata.AAC.4
MAPESRSGFSMGSGLQGHRKNSPDMPYCSAQLPTLKPAGHWTITKGYMLHIMHIVHREAWMRMISNGSSMLQRPECFAWCALFLSSSSCERLVSRWRTCLQQPPAIGAANCRISFGHSSLSDGVLGATVKLLNELSLLQPADNHFFLGRQT